MSKIQEAVPVSGTELEFKGLETSPRLGSKYLTIEYILRCLKNEGPDPTIIPEGITSQNEVKLVGVEDTGKIPSATGKGGWSRTVTYSATYKGMPVSNCQIEAHEGISDDGAEDAWWTVKEG